MKCPICHKPINYFDLEYLFVYQRLCNKCNKLFIYEQKNVRIKGVFIKFLTLKYYDYLTKYYRDQDCVFDYEKEDKHTYLISELNMSKVKARKNIILFRRQDSLIIKEIIKTLISKRSRSRVVFKEVIDFTKRTQDDY